MGLGMEPYHAVSIVSKSCGVTCMSFMLNYYVIKSITSIITQVLKLVVTTTISTLSVIGTKTIL